MIAQDVIVAQASGNAAAGVAVLRLSGPGCLAVLLSCLREKSAIPARQACLRHFVDRQGELLDQGIVLYFPAPHSFTGEDVVEFQGHGSPVMMARLVQELQAAGARLARPGEFSERAFHQGKMDLTQAEAIADLIAAGSEQAARSAMKSLQGEFSQRVHRIVDTLTELRVYIEAAIDFSDQDIDFLHSDQVKARMTQLHTQLSETLVQARQGQVLQQGASIVIAGHPNVGKSSLLNALAGDEVAIVSDRAGTTRDIVRQHLVIEGIPVEVLDTAGWRDSDDPIEQEGIRRALRAAERADALLYLFDSDAELADIVADLQLRSGFKPKAQRLLLVRNKIDTCPHWQDSQLWIESHPCPVVGISATTGLGLQGLRQTLAAILGKTPGELPFLARQRHVQALQEAATHLQAAQEQWRAGMADLLAEDLRLMQKTLGSITGEVLADELLGHIFSSFCIGK